MIGAGERVREALVGGYNARIQALRQCEIHQVVNRPVERNGEPDRVSAKGLVRVPPDRHIRYGGEELGGSEPINLAEPDLSPVSVGNFGSEQARGMEILPTVNEIARVS